MRHMTKRKGKYVAGPGRTPLKKKYGEELDRTTVRIPKSYIEFVKRFGNGSFSAGLRLLIEKEMSIEEDQ